MRCTTTRRRSDVTRCSLAPPPSVSCHSGSSKLRFLMNTHGHTNIHAEGDGKTGIWQRRGTVCILTHPLCTTAVNTSLFIHQTELDWRLKDVLPLNNDFQDTVDSAHAIHPVQRNIFHLRRYSSPSLEIYKRLQNAPKSSASINNANIEIIFLFFLNCVRV